MDIVVYGVCVCGSRQAAELARSPLTAWAALGVGCAPLQYGALKF